MIRCSVVVLVGLLFGVGHSDVVGQPTYSETSIFSFDGVVFDSTTVHSSDIGEYIVKFVSPPLAAVGQALSKRSAAQAAISAEHRRFENELSEMQNGAVNRSSRIRYRFTDVLNGMSVTLDRDSANRIRTLPFVESVRANPPVRIMERDAAATVRRPSSEIFNQGPHSGEGVTIAIVDTGIDWSHPDLGGGIGPGFKVIGGYDFVHNDDDPMDDHGHGTHVAGIAAADGAFTGMAPGASLLAYKVLDATGGGFTDTIIAGIERALDPDGEDLTSDAADIINLSLGADPYFIDTSNIEGFELLNEVIENVTMAGVLVIASAGNSGDASGTIGYPANAEAVLTVGAVDDMGQVAPFSSRGPSTGPSYALKPDVVAPGVDIESTWTGGGYRTLSGTSMAAPYVAGVAARLLGEHTEWEPFDVKSAIVHSATGIGTDPWAHGSGRVTYQQARAQTFSVATSLNFGLLEPDQSNWAAEKSVRLKNLSDVTQIITLLPWTLPSGVSVTTEPSQVLLEPGEITTVPVTVSFGDDLPDRSDLPYFGELSVSDGQTLTTLPFSFLKSAYMDLRLMGTSTGRSFFVLNESGDELMFAGGTDSARVLLPRGKYSVLAAFNNHQTDARTFIHEPLVSVEPFVDLVIDESVAEQTLALSTVDENGDEYSTTEVHRVAVLTQESVGLLKLSFSTSSQFNSARPHSYEIRTHGLEQAGFRFDWIVKNAIYDDTQYIYKASETDFQNRIELPGSVQMVPYTVRHVLPEHVQEAWFHNVSLAGLLGESYSSFGNPDAYLTFPFERRIVEMPDPADEFPITEEFAQFYELFDVAETEPGSMDADLLTLSPYTVVRPDGTIASRLTFGGFELDPVFISYQQNETIVPERGPYSWLGRLHVDGHAAYISTNTTRGVRWYTRHFFQEPFLPLFVSQARAVRPGHSRWTLFDKNDQLAGEGELGVQAEIDPDTFERHSFDQVDLTGDGPYELVFSSPPVPVGEVLADVQVRYQMSPTGDDSSPPTMRSIQVFDAAGRHADRLEVASTGLLTAAFADESVVSVDDVAWRTYGAANWELLPHSGENGVMEAALPAGSQERYVDLRIRVRDAGGNRLVYEAKPALLVGNPPRPTEIDAHPEVGETLQAYSLGQNWPNPFGASSSIEFTLPRGADTRLVVYDLLGRQVAALVDGVRSAGTHRIDVDADALAPGVYFYMLKTPGYSAVRKMIVSE